MKLILYDVDYNTETIFEDGFVLSIECENKNYFSKIIQNIKSAQNITMAIIENNNFVDLTKDAFVFIDYYNLSMYEKPLLTRFYKTIEKKYNGEISILESFTKITNDIIDLINNLTEEYNMLFETTIPTTIAEYLKFVDFKPTGGFNGHYEGVLNMLHLLSILKIYKLVIFVNAKSFFSENELGEIIKILTYNNQKALFIDNLITSQQNNNEIKILIDSDFYDILKK